MGRDGSAPYPKELRDQAVRLVREWREEHDRRDGGIREVANQLGVHLESVRNWVRQASVDDGEVPGVTTDEKARIRKLEMENAELRRANEILKAAATFFGAVLDCQHNTLSRSSTLIVIASGSSRSQHARTHNNGDLSRRSGIALGGSHVPAGGWHGGDRQRAVLREASDAPRSLATGDTRIVRRRRASGVALPSARGTRAFRWTVAVGLVAGFALLGAGRAQAAQTTTTTTATSTSVSGTLAAAGVPVPGVRITLSQGDKVLGQTRSDAQGRWQLSAPRPGIYQLQLDPATLPAGVRAERTELSNFRVFGGFPQHAVFTLTSRNTKRPHEQSTFDQLLNLFVSGIRFGLIIALCSVGLSVIYATTGLVNFAHGELVTFGALIAWLVSTMSTGPQLEFVAAAIIGVIATGMLGAMVELGIFRPMVHRRSGTIARMLVSIGLALFLRYLYEVIFNASPRSYREFAAPSPVKVGPLELPTRDYVIMAICAVVLVAVGLFLNRSRLGTAVRAVSDERDLSSASGIDVERVVLFVWIGGAALAGLGGIMLGLGSEGVQWNMGFRLLLIMFAAVVLGGLGSAYGAMVGGLVVGIASQVSTYWLPSDLQVAVGLAILILMLLVRPQGILGTAERVG